MKGDLAETPSPANGKKHIHESAILEIKLVDHIDANRPYGGTQVDDKHLLDL